MSAKMMTLINGELLSSPALSLLQRWGSLSHMRSLLYFFANEAVKKKKRKTRQIILISGSFGTVSFLTLAEPKKIRILLRILNTYFSGSS